MHLKFSPIFQLKFFCYRIEFRGKWVADPFVLKFYSVILNNFRGNFGLKYRATFRYYVNKALEPMTLQFLSSYTFGKIFKLY